MQLRTKGEVRAMAGWQTDTCTKTENNRQLLPVVSRYAVWLPAIRSD